MLKFIVLCIAFVLIGLVYALSERWQRELVVQGVTTRKPHIFDHLFVMWTLKQLLQLSLYFLCKFKDWCRISHLMHGAKTKKETLARPNVDDASDIDCQQLLPRDETVNRDPETENDNTQVRAGIANEVTTTRRSKTPSRLIYFPPAFFALAHVLLLYFGLKLTYSSSFIMLKGTVAFFTALLSLAFLALPLACHVWFGVVVATLGFVVSGISDYIDGQTEGYERYGIAAGDLLILMAQIMFATKIIYEEKFIRKHSIHPMMFLGCEGMYGTFFAIVLLLVFNFVDAVQYSNLPNGRLEDITDFTKQMYNSWKVILAVFGSLISYILYTYLGMFLIRDKGALTRIMIETIIWGLYWVVCLSLHWEHFFIAQMPGLSVIAIGAVIYANLLPLPFASRCERRENNEDNYEAEQNDDAPVDQDGNAPVELNAHVENDEAMLQG